MSKDIYNSIKELRRIDLENIGLKIEDLKKYYCENNKSENYKNKSLKDFDENEFYNELFQNEFLIFRKKFRDKVIESK